MLHSANRTAALKSSTDTPLVVICAIVFLSGIPALIYQTVWQRLLVLHSGVGTTSVATIVTAYLIGLGVGSWLGAGLTRKFSAQQAVWLVIGLELAIGAYAVASPVLLYDLLYWKFGWLYRNFWLAAILHLATLVIPTMFMGATLPLLTRALLSQRPELAKSLGLVYGSNTLGAGMGALLAPWLFMPYVGIRGTLSLGAICNLLVAISIWRCTSTMRGPNTASATKSNTKSNTKPSTSALKTAEAGKVVPFSLSLGLTLTFFTGLVAIGLEILWFRIIDVGVKSTAFTFGTVLCVYLVCMGLGSVCASSWTSRVRQPLTAFLWAQLVVIGSATLVLIVMLALPTQQAAQLPLIGWVYAYWSQGDPANPNVVSLATTLGLYALFPLVLMGPSALAMGYSFTMLQLGTQQIGDSAGYRLGLLQAANICGCAIGSLCVGLLLIDSLGTMGAWRTLMLASLLFPAIGFLMTDQKVPMAASGAALLLLTWLLPTNDVLLVALARTGWTTSLLHC